VSAEIHDAQSYTFYSQDQILFDANVWLYLEGPFGQDQRRVEAYSGLLELILARRNVLVTTPLVMSEFVNRYARLHYNTWAHRRSKSFKEFRSNSNPAYKAVQEGLDQACQTILGFCERAVCDITLEEMKADLATFASGSHDFNDLLLARLCRKESLILVTHDADFASLDGLTIVTANRKLLDARAD
jgi:predicted nucleic acid-binding protein